MNLTVVARRALSVALMMLSPVLCVPACAATANPDGQRKVEPRAESRVQDKPAGAPRANEDAVALQAFNERLERYVALHRKLEAELEPLESGGADAATIDAHQKALAAKLRAARTNAKEGDIFEPEIRAWFRRAIAREMAKPGGANARRAIMETGPGHVPHAINGLYPDSLPVSTMPASLLANLPRTPEEVEFRFVSRDLILRDTHANLIVDVVHEAIR